MYRIDSGIWSSVFALPCEIVDKHIKLCGALPLKVLLIMLRHGRTMNAQELAEMLGQSSGDIQDAVNYWVHLGIILQEDTITPTLNYTEEAAPAIVVPSAQPATLITQAPARREEQNGEGKIIHLGKPRRLTISEVAELSQEDTRIQTLLDESQSAFGRTLKPTESESIVTIYVRYEMPPDIILMLLHYCVSIGKAGMAYIEKVAQDWCEREIDTHEKVEAEITRLSAVDETDRTIRNLFGISGRNITTRERELYLHWTNGLGFKDALIKLAFERTVDQKGKLSFAYTNAILANWHKKGIATLEAAMNETHINGRNSETRSKNGSEPQASYNINRFEELLASGSLMD